MMWKVSLAMSFLIDDWILSNFLHFRIRVGDISHKWLVFAGRSRRGALPEKGVDPTSAGGSHYTWRHRIDESETSKCVRRRSAGGCFRLERCHQLGCPQETRARHHLHETSLLESHSVREVRVSRCWRFGELREKIILKRKFENEFFLSDSSKLRRAFRARRIFSCSRRRMARLLQLRCFRFHTKCWHVRKVDSVCWLWRKFRWCGKKFN